MLARRIIPCLDVRDGVVVKGEKFTNIKEIGDPSTLGQFYSDSGADELVFYDITASHEKREISLKFVEEVAKKISIPFCVGGGINSLEDIKKVLRKGADKVSINSSAVKNPQLIKEGSEFFGAQCIVLSIDAKKKEDGNYSVFINGGRKDTNLDPVEWAIRGVELGAGEIVLNSIDQDGVKNGYDCELLKMITDAVNVPVIASGGAGTMEHFLEAVEKSNVDGILAASVFHKGEIDITDLKKYLKQNNIEVRL